MRISAVCVGLVFAVAAAACGGTDPVQEDGPAPVDARTDSAPADAPTDALEIDAPIDGPPIGACDPLAAPGQQGCSPGQKCTWIRVQDQPTSLGVLGCVPDGTVANGGACTQGAAGETTGFDNCTAGNICIGGLCKDICGFDGSANAACAAGNNCTRYSGLFSNNGDDPIAGACNPSCDPITQMQSTGQPCASGQGCYLLTNASDTVAVCAAAGTIAHGVTITGTPFANSCVPGAQPRRRDGTSTTVECGGLCAPADVTSTTNMASEGGVSPNSCALRWGAAPPQDGVQGESCRYWWAREPFDTLSAFSNTVGWCYKHAVFQYDTNNDQVPDAPFPRCIALTTGDIVPPIGNPPHNDAQYFWCVALPPAFGGAPAHLPRAREPRFDTLAP